jgi:peptidyl-prolyl cis-trans isomerase D
LLDSIRKGQRWLTMLFVGVIGLVFVFFLGLGQPLDRGPAGAAIIQLDDIRMDISDFERTRSNQEARFRDALGDQFDADTAREFLDSQALESLIQTAILAHAAQELGLVVSKTEIQRRLVSLPQFRDEEGRFVREAFEDWAEYNFGTQRNFLQVMRHDMLSQKMIQLLYAQSAVSDGEARRSALQRLEEVSVAYVALDTAKPPIGKGADDVAADEYLASHPAAARELYDSRVDAYSTPEKVRARHILLKLELGADDETAAPVRERAEALLVRLRGGEDFSAVAIELSEDPGTRGEGGDLGSFARGERVPELEEAAFALEAGQLSEIVESRQGLHIVLVEERIEAGQQPFDDVAREIARELANAEIAREYADRVSAELASAVREGRSLEEAARGIGLPIERPDPLRRRADGFVTGLGAAPEVLSAAFALGMDAASSPRVFQVGTQLVLIQLLERSEPAPELLAESLNAERQRLLGAKRNRAIQDWIDADRKTLTESGRLMIDSSIVSGNS